MCTDLPHEVTIRQVSDRPGDGGASAYRISKWGRPEARSKKIGGGFAMGSDGDLPQQCGPWLGRLGDGGGREIREVFQPPQSLRPTFDPLADDSRKAGGFGQ